MRDRTSKVIKMARHHVAEMLKYCHHRSGRRPTLNGRVLMCSGCAYDAVANAIEAAIKEERARVAKTKKGERIVRRAG